MELKWAAAAVAGILLAVLCVWLAALFIKWLSSLDWTFESASERSGRHGEEIAVEIISRVLKEGDHLLTNIEIAYDGRRAEMDCIVVNKFGVFIFEVKNYSGQLAGDEDDYEWQKVKITDSGNMYAKQVKNPIRQLKRQIYLLAHYLQDHRIRVWVEGRTRLRVIIWKQWKVPKKRQWGLEKLGIGKDLARQTSYMGDHYQWVVTKTCVVRAISKEKLSQAGLVSCNDYYLERHALKLC